MMLKIQRLRDELYEELPHIAREFILSDRYQQPDEPYRTAFADHPDDPLMHNPSWHQWGVVSHTRTVGHYLAEVVPAQLGEEDRKLGLAEERIDGICKWELLLLSVPAHDWGKFCLRQFEGEKTAGRPKFGFAEHEAESGRLVRLRSDRLIARGLTSAQVEYVARAAELNFELGKLRKTAKSSGGYTMAWTSSPSFAAAARAVALSQPGFEREMGLLFLADNWGKTDLLAAAEARTDEEIEGFRPQLEATIAERGLHPGLLGAGLQLPVNLAVGRRYLELLLDGRSTG